MALLQPDSTLVFLCDVQTKFRPAIHGYDQVIVTANKMLKIAKLVGSEVIVTIQNSKALGPTDPAIDTASLGSLLVAIVDKTKFSMLTEEVSELLNARSNVKSIVLLGIEAHVCILQTALQLMNGPKSYRVYVLYDGVASSSAMEMNIAIDRLRAQGAVITTSESVGFELVGDANKPHFREFSKVIKEAKLGKVDVKM